MNGSKTRIAQSDLDLVPRPGRPMLDGIGNRLPHTWTVGENENLAFWVATNMVSPFTVERSASNAGGRAPSPVGRIA